MKVLAMYLPQFHRVRENDLWWGEGFTDWVSTKRARPLFEGHYQPHVPLNGNYYDLTDKSTMQWQADLMRKYEVDGICMHHYWFKEGRRILEKPAENLLDWKDIQMPFCFCWANPTWARSWSGFRGANAWSVLYEKQVRAEKNGILLEQKYGEEQEWKKHFEYLLPFFQDKRYIKIKDKPVFMIYCTSDIPCLQQMLECWQVWAVEAGLLGLYIIGAHCRNRIGGLDAQVFLEPGHSIGEIRKLSSGSRRFRIGYREIWQNILQTPREELHTYFGGVVGYDDTPRQGQEGTIIEGADPGEFGEFLSELMAKNAANGNEIVFLNAWNEWGEGMHLEPDEKFGTKFLEEIPFAKAVFPEKISKYEGEKTEEKRLTVLKRQSEKFEDYLNLVDQWMNIRENGVNLAESLQKRGIQSVVIYGFGIFGRHLLWELEGSGIDIIGIIDWKKDKLYTDYPVYLPTDRLPKFDTMVVTAWHFYDEIREMYAGRGYDLLSIEALIKERI